MRYTRRKPRKVVVRVKSTRLKNGTKLRIYYYGDEKPAKAERKGSRGKAQ